MENNAKDDRIRELKKLIATYEWDIKMNQFPPGKMGYLESLKKEFEDLTSVSDVSEEKQEIPSEIDMHIKPPQL